MAQQEGVESAEKVYPTIPRKFERLRDVIFHSIWGSFAIGLVLLGSVPSPGPNNRPMQTLILFGQELPDCQFKGNKSKIMNLIRKVKIDADGSVTEVQFENC